MYLFGALTETTECVNLREARHVGAAAVSIFCSGFFPGLLVSSEKQLGSIKPS